jgi:hypothetical protein
MQLAAQNSKTRSRTVRFAAMASGFGCLVTFKCFRLAARPTVTPQRRNWRIECDWLDEYFQSEAMGQ